MINKSIKYIGVILLAYTLNACNEQRMNSSSETTTPVWLAEVGKRDVRELTTTTGTAKAAKTVEVKSETNGKYELMINPKTKRPYKLGDIVEEGAVLIKLNNKEHENTVSLSTKKMQVDIAKKEWEGQKAVFEKGVDGNTDAANAVQKALGVFANGSDAEKANVGKQIRVALVKTENATKNANLQAGIVNGALFEAQAAVVNDMNHEVAETGKLGIAKTSDGKYMLVVIVNDVVAKTANN